MFFASINIYRFALEMRVDTNVVLYVKCQMLLSEKKLCKTQIKLLEGS
jgi:hypothetical protein